MPTVGYAWHDELFEFTGCLCVYRGMKTTMDQLDVAVEQPLGRYALHQDAEAFAHLVRQYQHLVFATCRRRLYNPADTDDAVQETFLRLAQNAGGIRGNLGGWLHSCAVNTSIDLNRRRSTRLRHETAAAVLSEAAGDRQQLLVELRDQVDAALEKLDPEQRELIIQRYFVGRPQVELAAEMNLAASTISYRLDRAIEGLRQHLGTLGCGGLAGGGTAVVVAMLEAEHASAAVPAALTANLMKIGLSGVSATGATVAGSILTAGTLKVVLGIAAAIVVAVGGVWIVVGQGSSRTVPPTAPRPVVAQNTPAAPVIVTGGGADAAQAQAPRWQTTQPSTQPAVLSGRVLDKAGKPVAGATVSLSSGPQPTVETKTDAQGNYVFRTIKNSGEYRIGVQAAGFVPIEPYYMDQNPAVQLTSQSQARRDMVIERGVTIEVTVADAKGQPVAKANIDVNLSGERREVVRRVQTDDMGFAEVVLPVSQSAYVVAASLNGYAPTHATVTPKSADAPQEVSLLMMPGLGVKGTVICSDDKPAAGWEIYAQPDWWASYYIPRGAKIDKDGSFTLTDVGEGQYSLYLSIPLGQGSSTSRGLGSVTFSANQQPLRLTASVPSAASRKKVTGRVRVVGGRPNYVSVQATSLGGDSEYHSGQVQFGLKPGKPNDGEFSFEAVPPGTYRISFESPEIEPKVIDKVELPGELPVVELTVVGKPRLTGKVVDAVTGKPIPQFAVRARKVEHLGNGPGYVQDARWTQVSNPEGRFDIQLVGPGVYQAQVSLEGYAWMWSPRTRIEKGSAKTDLTLKATGGGSLSGVVLDPSGKPAPGVKVIPHSMAMSIASRSEDRFEGDAGAVKTDWLGRFTLPHLAAGQETLKFVHPDYAPLIVPHLPVTDGQTTEVAPASLHVGGTIEGVIYDGDGKPSAGSTLHLQDDFGYGGGGDEEAGRLAVASTDDNGHFRIEHLPTQLIYVNVGDQWRQQGVVRRSVRPLDAKVTRLDFGGTATVKGRLLIAGKGLSTKRVQLAVESQYFGPVVVNATTDADGRFTFYGPPVGPYTLYAAAGSGESDLVRLQEVQVTGQPLDLGDIAVDVGDVVLTMQADDPADLNAVQYVGLLTDRPDSTRQESVGRAGFDSAAGGRWVAKAIPAGKLRVAATLKGSVSASYSVPFERKAGAAQTPVTLRLPRASATLSLGLLKSAGADGQKPGFVELRNEDSTVRSWIRSDGPQPCVLKLPAGTYRVMDRLTDKLREDIEPITLKDGEQRDAQIALLAPQAKPRSGVVLYVWAADGTPIFGAAPVVTDSAGKPVEPVRGDARGSAFFLLPGHYSATVQRPGAAAFAQQFDVAAPEATPKAGPAQTVDLVMP